MTKKINCWEYMKCGREVGGERAEAEGVCPASTEEVLDGCNCGENAGRSCWVVAGTLCCGGMSGTYANKICDCISCGFYNKVMMEEDEFTSSKELIDRLNSKPPAFLSLIEEFKKG